jgi:hypothetical protein
MAISELTEAKKTEVWNHMLSLPKSLRPRGMSDVRFERLKDLIWNDTDFWQAVLGHGTHLVTLDELKAYSQPLYESFIGTFFMVLYHLAIESKPTKPYLDS